ncbi:MAG TPA: hypothetical protein VL461_03735 [Dictyobacter sp.]|jgi:hypothetical protein|nr:hypothetical protein [Dictyobacter sp.]
MDVWDDTNNTDIHVTAARVPARDQIITAASSRRPTERAFLALVRQWLLQDYVPTYCNILATTRIFRRYYWVDALRGYPKTSLNIALTTQAEETKNNRRHKQKKQFDSPQPRPEALQPFQTLTRTLLQEQAPVTFYGILLIGSNSKRQTNTTGGIKGGQITHDLAQIKESSILPTNWSDIAAPLLKAIEPAPATFLLNPLSPIILDNDYMTPLYRRTAPTEIFLFLNHKQISLCLQEAQKNSTQATALTSLLRTNRWKTLSTREEQRTETVTTFITLLRTAMQRHFQYPPQEITLPLISGPVSLNTAPYSLIYATRRQDSLLLMNDVLCRYQRQLYQHSYHGVLSEEWFAQQEEQRHTLALQQLTKQIKQQGEKQRARRWPDLRQQFVLKQFGKFTQQEYDMLIQQLLSNQEVHCIWQQKKDIQVRIPDNYDTLQW